MDPCDKTTADFLAPMQAFAYFLGNARAIYVSAPINSGWRFLTWYEEKGRKLVGLPAYKEAHARDVVAVNRGLVAETMAAIKHREHPTPVLDPTAFDVPGWIQEDYRCFWGKVIQRFVGRAIFLNGWEASFGCVYELSVAVKTGIPIFDEGGAPINPQQAIELIRRSLNAMAELGLETDVLQGALGAIRGPDGFARTSGG